MTSPMIAFNVLGTVARHEVVFVNSSSEVTDISVHFNMSQYPNGRSEQRLIPISQISEIAPYGESDGFPGVAVAYLRDQVQSYNSGSRVGTVKTGLLVKGDVETIRNQLSAPKLGA